jgi:hypothetical protein
MAMTGCYLIPGALCKPRREAMHIASARLRSLKRSLAQNAGRGRISNRQHESLMTVVGHMIEAAEPIRT